jgi:hypothetical protein
MRYLRDTHVHTQDKNTGSSQITYKTN